MTGRRFGKPFILSPTYASAPIPTKQRTYAFWGLPALAFALHGWQRWIPLRLIRCLQQLGQTPGFTRVTLLLFIVILNLG